jgi:zinc D-Ala-D-Ala carboxypeptidase
MNLTKNFTLHEMTKSDTALRKGLENQPSETELNSLIILAQEILQPVRDHYKMGVKVNSGYRSPLVNTAAGGSKTSDHMTGAAADIEIPSVPNADLALFISQNFKFTQIILEFYTQGIPDSGWVHVSYNPSNLKCQVITAVKNKEGKTVYLNGIHI